MPSSYYPPPPTSGGGEGSPEPIRQIYQVAGDFQIPEAYGGIYQTQAGSVNMLPSYTDNQIGLDYVIKNGSDGQITITTPDGEMINNVTGVVTTMSTNPGNSRTFRRLGDSQDTWIIH